jgi:hypothetical protein
VRLINYAFDTWYTNESIRQSFETNAIRQQDNLYPNGRSNMESNRVCFSVGRGYRNYSPCLWNTRRSRGCSDWTDGYPLCLFLEKRVSWSKNAAVIWNALGIADLVMAISLGLITSQEQLAATGTATMQTFPWILIPAIAVPVTLTLHGITLYRLKDWEPVQQLHREFSGA